MSERIRLTPALTLDPEVWPEAARNFQQLGEGAKFRFDSGMLESDEDEAQSHRAEVTATHFELDQFNKFVFTAIRMSIPIARTEFHLDYDHDFTNPDLRVFHLGPPIDPSTEKPYDIVGYQINNGLIAPSLIEEFNFRVILRDFHEALLEARTGNN